MKTTLCVFVAVLAAACGTVTHEPADTLGEGQDRLAPPLSPPLWYTVSETKTGYRFSSIGFDVSFDVAQVENTDPDLDTSTFKTAFSTVDQLIVQGHPDGAKAFDVYALYQALPRVLPVKPAAAYRPTHENIACFTTPCPTWSLAAIDGSPDTAVETIDLTHTWRPGVDEAWLTARMEQGRTVLVGVADAPTSLDVRALYLRLPERPVCDLYRPGCNTKGEVATWSRDTNRCMVFEGCAEPGPCIEKPMQCDEGYHEVRFATQPNACEVVRCDPYFAE
ncbi:MAG: hypothetical protein JNK82_05680 [Myxococcaceae bacterium]|nr:hypothetical protein [Myxococcaceae bacterium]